MARGWGRGGILHPNDMENEIEDCGNLHKSGSMAQTLIGSNCGFLFLYCPGRPGLHRL